MNNAILKDINKEYLEAVTLYEQNISLDTAIIDDFSNLSFLYWSFAAEQIEFNFPNNISDDLSIIGGERFIMVLNQGLKKFPNSLELNFWNRYFFYRLYTKPFTEIDCEKLFKCCADDESLMPYFFLNLFNKEKYQDKVNKLVILCEKLPTAKHNYIYSFLK